MYPSRSSKANKTKDEERNWLAEFAIESYRHGREGADNHLTANKAPPGTESIRSNNNILEVYNHRELRWSNSW